MKLKTNTLENLEPDINEQNWLPCKLTNVNFHLFLPSNNIIKKCY